MATLRTMSMDYWYSLSDSDKNNLMQGDFEGRKPKSLTGREIEIIYLRQTK